MAKTSTLSKNIDPAITAFITAYVDEALASLEAKIVASTKTANSSATLKKDVASLKTDFSSLKSSIEGLAERIKKSIDDRLISVEVRGGAHKDEIKKIIDECDARVAAFQQSVDDLQYKMTRYFDKEKYAITKGLITQIMNEERENG